MIKRILCILLCVVLFAMAMPMSVWAKPAVILGDVNGDGQCTAIDFVAVKRHVMGTYRIPDQYLENADINRDGKLNTIDYTLVKRMVLNTYTPPVEDEPQPDDTTQAVLTLSLLLKNGTEEELVLLEGLLNVSVDELNAIVLNYLATLSVDGETIVEWEDGIVILPEDMEKVADVLGDLLAEYILSALLEQRIPTP